MSERVRERVLEEKGGSVVSVVRGWDWSNFTSHVRGCIKRRECAIGDADPVGNSQNPTADGEVGERGEGPKGG